MPSKIFSASIFGFDCRTVEVEVDILNGPASITIVGLGDISVQESKERIRSAIKNSGVEYPRRKKTINLAPADLKKHGPMFDLPIALGLLVQSGQIPENSLYNTLVVGELSLDGKLRHIKGALPIAAFAAEQKFSQIIIPQADAEETSTVSSIKIISAPDLSALIKHLRGEEKIQPQEKENFDFVETQTAAWCFEDIRGQEQAKRALMIAASGNHNVLLYGPPGSGKTLLARSFQSILPKLSFEEAIEVTKIYSIAGKLHAEQKLVSMPPFRAVHHTASPISLVGGGAIPKPGEVSLAHRGILFLDELLEFPQSTLDCLRQPIEDGAITVTRVFGSVSFPADFSLIAATNPCQCGYFGDSEKNCTCTPSQLQKYRKKLSGPLLDRIDLMVYAPRIPFEKIIAQGTGEQSISIRRKVTATRELQRKRYGKPLTNGKIPSTAVRTHCSLNENATKLLKEAFRTMHHSGRAYYRILKVARTIADLENSREINEQHLAEALQYRPRFELDAR